VGAYSCLAVNTPIRSAKGIVGQFGDPFWARIDFATGTFAWCKINPLPGEQASGAGAPSVPLAPACDLSRRAPVPLPFGRVIPGSGSPSPPALVRAGPARGAAGPA
jgi:hypothetical protein